MGNYYLSFDINRKLGGLLILENSKRYDLFFLCDDDIPYDDTWDRSGDQKRHVIHKQIIADFKDRKIPYIVLRGKNKES